MTDTMNDAADAGADRMNDALNAGKERMNEAGQKMTEATQKMGEVGQKMADNGSTIGVKMIEQAETNTREAFNAMRAAAEAKDIAEVLRIQGEFLREQSNRSMTQAREVGELIMQFGREAVAPFRQG